MAERASTERSVERALDLLEELARWPYGVTLADITAESGLNKTTVYRLLNTLIAKKYVLREPNNGKYRLSMRLFELGSCGRNGRQILNVALPYLEYLGRKTNHTVSLAIPDGTDIVYLFKGGAYDLGHRTPTPIHVGLRAPMYCCGNGKSILAALPDPEIDLIWKSSNITPFTPHTITSFEQFKREIAACRINGYAVDHQEHDFGFVGISAAILDSITQRPCAGIGVSGRVELLGDPALRALAPEVMKAANEISALLNS